MGVLNVTPDSFSDGGAHADVRSAVDAALRMEDEGADIIDVGGESTRPGAEPVPADEEMARVLPVLEGLAGRIGIPLSIDTYKARVADEALVRGAVIVNDISALRYDPALAEVAVRRSAGLILMHSRGRSADMYREAVYRSVPDDVVDELRVAVDRAVAAGVPRERLLIDPGLGFAKRADHSYAALAGLDRLASLDRPLVVGPSRKSFVRRAAGEVRPDGFDPGTAAAVTAAVLMGAHVVRVHAVSHMRAVVGVADRIRAGGE
jgi:dihydropteroate synthase